MDFTSIDSTTSTTASSSRHPSAHHHAAGTGMGHDDAGSTFGLDDLSFDNYCIVCDRLIDHPVEPEVVPSKTTKKKAAAGTIRVKNPDGSTTTRSANGTKVTRPALKRNTSSANRLAAVAAANATVKLAPLTRSKTADPAPTHSTPDDTPPNTSPKSPSASSPQQDGKNASASGRFKSNIYCSMHCAAEDAGRSTEAFKVLSRTLSNEFALPHPPFASEHGVYYVNDYTHDAHAPPSPLFISGSDTDSSNAGPEGPEGPACSAPKTLEYFRISKEGPDDAWRAHQRQRRSSMHPSIAPVPMARQLSNHSSVFRGYNGMSSDSLSSLWNGTATEADLDALARTTSSGGHSDRAVLGTARRSTSAAQPERSAPMPLGRAISRSNLSQTSLATASPVSSLPREMGSSSSHAFDLLQSYATAFPVREGSRRPSTSHSSKSFALPASFTSARRDSMSSARRDSLSMTPQTRPDLQTVRLRSGVTTWDEFGLEEVEANNARARAKARNSVDSGAPSAIKEVEAPTTGFKGGLSVPKSLGMMDITPKQSLEVENGKWKVRYNHPHTSIPMDSAKSTIRGCGSGTIRAKKSGSNGQLSARSGRSHSSSSSEEDSPVLAQVPSVRPVIIAPSPASARPALSRAKSDYPTTGRHDMPPPSMIPNRAGLVRLDSPNPSDSTPRAMLPHQSPLLSASLGRSSSASVPRDGYFSSSPSRYRSSPSSKAHHLQVDAHGHAVDKHGRTMPNLAALRCGSTSAPGSGRCTPLEVPRAGFNWSDHEKRGGKTYELPQGLKIDRSKAGLFYFN